MPQPRLADRWTVGEVAELTRVSVRTLHHYDAVGLLSPSARSEAGYRLYAPADVARLWRILTFRELGFALADIGKLLGSSPEAEREALGLQAALLREQLARTQARLSTVTSLLRAAERGEGDVMTKEKIEQMFEGFDPSEYDAEVKERWGDTEAYRQSAERMARYTPADRERMTSEGAELHARYAALLGAGTPADSPEAAAVAEAHRAYFDQWFYDCTPEMLKMVSHHWVSDPRFTANIDGIRPGLAAYERAAVQAWAEGAGTE